MHRHSGTEWIESYCQYQDGKRHGYYQSWYASGLPRLVGRYDQDVPAGVWLRFYPTGVIAERGNVSGDGSEGASLRVTESGYQGEFRREGKWYQYWRDGSIKAYGTYRDGLREGEWREFTPDGKLYSVSSYANGDLVFSRVVSDD